jgi:hypothetical protein
MGPWQPLNRFDLAQTQVHWLVVFQNVCGETYTDFMPRFERPTYYGGNERQRHAISWPVLVLKVTPK